MRSADVEIPPVPARSKLRRRWWQDARFSLWAPVTVFGAALLVYIATVEAFPACVERARPVLQALGLLMVAAFALLAVARLLLSSFRTHLALSARAGELAQRVRGLLAAHATKLEPKALGRLCDQLVLVETLWLASAYDKLSPELAQLAELSDKHLQPHHRRSVAGAAWSIAKLLLIVLVIRGVLIEPYKIPSSSMMPTLEIGDHVFINKFLYGVRIPWLNVVPFVIVRPPRKGDIIVFEDPTNTSIDMIKRIVGVGGDRLDIEDDLLFINGERQPTRVLELRHPFFDKREGEWSEGHATLEEEMLDGRPHFIYRLPLGHSVPVSATVPEGHIFVMGDNRDNSDDSRLGFTNSDELTFVPFGNIKGKAMVIWLGLGHDGLLSSLFGGTGLRVDRMFLPVR